MSEGLIVSLAIAAFLIGFPLFWMAIISLIATLGGWKKLARKYAAEEPASGETFSMSSARLGRFTNYSNCLTVAVSSKGIHMRPFFLMKIGHVPLFIPWHSISHLTRRNILITSSVHMSITGKDGGGPTTLVFYGKKLADSLMRHDPQHTGDK